MGSPIGTPGLGSSNMGEHAGGLAAQKQAADAAAPVRGHEITPTLASCLPRRLIPVKVVRRAGATLASMKAIGSAPELYAYAIAIEREAAARYSELAQQMS